jgi:hypothetical protein
MFGTPLEHIDVSVPFYQLNVTGSDSATAAGGTAAANHWTPMTNTQVLGAKVIYDARDAGYLSQIIVQQAQDAAGTNLKTVKSFTFTSAQIAASGNTVAVNLHAAELDSANNFTHVRIKVIQTGGSATNKFTVIYTKMLARFVKQIWDGFTLRLPQDQAQD